MCVCQFGSDPTIVGHVLRLTGVPYTVIGVMPRGFMLPPIFTIRLVGVDVVLKEADFWLPLKIDTLPQRREMFGRERAMHRQSGYVAAIRGALPRFSSSRW